MLENISRYNNWIVLLILAFYINLKYVAMFGTAYYALLGLFVLISYRFVFEKIDKFLIFIFAILPIAYLFNMILLGFELNQLDRPSRLLLAILIFLYFRLFRIESKFILFGIFFCLIIASGIAFVEIVILGYDRAGGFFSPYTFGNIGLLLSFIGIGLIFIKSEINIYSKIMFIFFIGVLGLWVSIASGTRGGWISIPFFVFVLSYFSPIITNKFRFVSLLITVVLMFSSYFLIDKVKYHVDLGIRDVNLILKSPPDPHRKEGSLDIRIEMWIHGLQLFKESPVFGVGFKKYNQIVQEDIKNEKLHPYIGQLRHLHSDPINMLVKQGVVGLSILIIFWSSLFFFFFKRFINYNLSIEIRSYALIGVVTVSGMIFFSLFDSMFGNVKMITMYVFLLGLSAGNLRGLEENAFKKVK